MYYNIWCHMVPNMQYAPQCVYDAVQLHTMTYYEFKHNISKIYQNELCHTIQYHNHTIQYHILHNFTISTV